jgi:hypothetical protein
MRAGRTSSSRVDPSEPVVVEPAGGGATFTGWGLRVPLPPLAVYGIALLVLSAVGSSLSAKVIGPAVEEMRRAMGRIAIDREQVVQLTEGNRHIGETAMSEQELLHDDLRGEMKVRYYGSDGCVLIVRKQPGAASRWIPHWIPAVAGEGEPSPGRVVDRRAPRGAPAAWERGLPRPTVLRASIAGASSDAARLAFAGPGTGRGLVAPRLAFAELRVPAAGGPPTAAAPVQACSGRCSSPHSGSFETREGERKGCWVQVWRQWPDGCAHYQWFNTCESYWDSDANGPKVHWTCCVH